MLAGLSEIIPLLEYVSKIGVMQRDALLGPDHLAESKGLSVPSARSRPLRLE